MDSYKVCTRLLKAVYSMEEAYFRLFEFLLVPSPSTPPRLYFFANVPARAWSGYITS